MLGSTMCIAGHRYFDGRGSVLKVLVGRLKKIFPKGGGPPLNKSS